MFREYRQLQEQQQEVAHVPTAAPVINPPPTLASISDDIASFMKDEPAAASGEDESALEASADDASDSPALAQVTDDEEAQVAEADEAEDEEAPAKPKHAVDFDKLNEALEAEDMPAFIEALGPAADKLLTSKAHKALRIAARDLTKQKKEATEAQAKAGQLTTALADKYSDPIAVRKAIEASDPNAVDKFLDYAEKTAGADWNAIMKWVAKGLVGRPERLAVKAKAVTDETAKQSKEQADALAQTQTWVKAEVTKADPLMLTDAPEVVDLVIEEIRHGYSKGITSPAKALPLVLKKLEAQHAKLSKLLARKGVKAGKVVTPAPAARVGKRADADTTRPRTLEEDIAWTKREMGIK